MRQSDRAYCFNPTCQAPINLAGSITCHCGAALLLQNRYQGLSLLSNRSTTHTFLALDHQTLGHPHCIIQQFCNHSYTTALPVISHLEILSRHPQIPSSQDYFEQDGVFYWVQDYIPGQTLATQLIEQGKFSVDEVWCILENLLPICNYSG
jgi:serine/threonine protein kinase